MKKLLISALFACVSAANASVITSFGLGSAVADADRIATFDNLSNGSWLGNYTEGGLSISVNDTQCCFTGVYYGTGGNNSYVTISTTDGSNFRGLELDLLTGFGSGLHNVVWETQRDGITTGHGVLTDVYAPTGYYGNGTVLGWSDTNLFDRLLIGAAIGTSYDRFGEFQAVALDNVKIDLVAPVPLPAAAWLFGSALVGFSVIRKRKTTLAA